MDFVLAASVTAGLLMMGLFRQSTVAQVGRADAVIARSCDAIAQNYRFYMANWAGPAPQLDGAEIRRGLNAVVQMALRDQLGVEGGIWHGEAGSLAYAFPTYDGTGPKTDLPAAELPRIRSINVRALNDERGKSQRIEGRSQTLLLYACALSGVIPSLTAWTMTRVPKGTGQGFSQLRLGLGMLLACVLAAAALLSWLIVSWLRNVAAIEAALGGHASTELPALVPTGEPDLDRIVMALNQAGTRLTEARRESDSMTRKIATAERLAAIGRMTAAFAHEIRNPIAAMRLKAENAIAGDDARRRTALDAIIGQIGRLDRLVEQLLTASHRKTPDLAPVTIKPFLQATAQSHREAATSRGVRLTVQTDLAVAPFDHELIGRALDNLIGNALQHMTEGGEIVVEAGKSNDNLRFTVRDTGPGIAPELRDTLFEPFVTGRADGTGLGLSIVREIVESHGGQVHLVASETGACFEIELPLGKV